LLGAFGTQKRPVYLLVCSVYEACVVRPKI